MGVCERVQTESRPLEKKPTVTFEKLLDAAALGTTEVAAVESLAGRLIRLERRFDERTTRELKRLTDGPTLSTIASDILDAGDPDHIEAKARETKPPAHEPTAVELARPQQALADDAVRILATRPQLRNWLIEFQRTSEQTIDTVSKDTIIEAGFSAAALDAARGLVRSWEQFVSEHRDEITAIQLLYTDAKRLRYEQLKELADAIERPPRRWTTDALWSAYERLGRAAGTSQPTAAGRKHILADLVALVRVALHEQDTLVPRTDTINVRFDAWLAEQATRGRAFTAEQRAWLELIRDHVATSLAIEQADFDLSPFAQQGGLGHAAKLFGPGLPNLLDELNQVLAA